MYLVPHSRVMMGDASQLPRRRLRPGPRRVRRRFLLGQLTDFVGQAVAPYQSQAFYQHIHDFVSSDLAAGVVDSGGNYATGAGVCAGQAPSIEAGTIAAAVGVTGASVAGGILRLVAPAIAAGPVGIGIAIGAAVIGLFAALFKPNAYTRQESAILCQAVPTANAVLNQVDGELKAGTITPQQGIQAYNTLLQQFDNAVAPIINHTAGNYAQTGDNAEFVSASLKAIVLQRVAAIHAAIAPAPAPAAMPTSVGISPASIPTIVGRAAASVGLPSWVFYLVGGVLVYELI